LLADFGVTALAAGLAAVLAVGAVGAVLVGRPTWAWLLSMPAAIAMIFAAACWPLLRATIGGLAGRGRDRPTTTPAPALLAVARSLAVRPRVLLMDEPCSALDPTSTRVIEETIDELVREVTIVIVTHNMQQAQRVSHQCAFFLAAQGQPGYIVEYGPTGEMFDNPQDPRTADYVGGRFG
jgi:hypothetical protein